MKGCQRSGTKVTCSAWVTQINKDESGLYTGKGSTRLIDAAGTEYTPSSIQVGSKIDDSSLRIYLVKDIPLLLSATFTDIPKSVQDVALFELGFYSGLRGQLRNTKITESQGGNPPATKKKK